MALEDYKDIVATSAMICTMLHMLSGTLICKDFYKNGTSKGFDPAPFVGGIGMCIIMLRYALILQDPIMITVNVFGALLNIMYMSTYVIYTPNKGKAFSLFGKLVGFVLITLAYAEFENKDNLENRYGILVTILMLLLIASPFLNLGTVIRTKDTSILPFPLIFMGTIVSIQWLLYGLIIDNKFIINGVGSALSAAQLSLFVIYPSKAKVAKKSE